MELNENISRESLRLRRLFRYLKVGVNAPDLLGDLTFGRASDLTRIKAQLSDVATGSNASLFIEGAYGRGKSHLLKATESLALGMGFATCWVTLDGFDHALNHPARYFHSIAESLRLPGSDVRGLSSHIRAWLTGEKSESVIAWAKVSPNWLGYSIWTYHKKLWSNPDRAWITSWIDGRDISRSSGRLWFDRVSERLDQIADLLRSMGFAGLVIFFDELETVATLLASVRQRMLSYEFLNLLLDGRRHRHCFFAFAATPDFDLRVNDDSGVRYLYTETYAGGVRFVEKWQRGELSRVSLKTLKVEEIAALCIRLREHHESAFSWRIGNDLSDEVVSSLVRRCHELSFSVRDIIRSFVHLLEIAEQHGSSDLVNRVSIGNNN